MQLLQLLQFGGFELLGVAGSVAGKCCGACYLGPPLRSEGCGPSGATAFATPAHFGGYRALGGCAHGASVANYCVAVKHNRQ